MCCRRAVACPVTSGWFLYSAEDSGRYNVGGRRVVAVHISETTAHVPTATFLRITCRPFKIGLMKLPCALCLIGLVCWITSCGGASHGIVGTWRAGDDSNAMVWQFSDDGSVLMGTNRGRYSFGDNNRIKIQTSMATSVYQVERSGDKMTLQDPNGSKLVLIRVNY
jgi:hypothetical protein